MLPCLPQLFLQMIISKKFLLIVRMGKDPVIVIIPTGGFRSVSCITEHDGQVMTQFCHPRDIDVEMERYCALARNLL
jgi:hypothetical protein